MRKLCLCIGIGTVLLGTMSQDVFCTPIEEMSAVAETTGMRELQHNVGATSVAIHTMQELDAREQSLNEYSEVLEMYKDFIDMAWMQIVLKRHLNVGTCSEDRMRRLCGQAAWYEPGEWSSYEETLKVEKSMDAYDRDLDVWEMRLDLRENKRFSAKIVGKTEGEINQELDSREESLKKFEQRLRWNELRIKVCELIISKFGFRGIFAYDF